jgi:hypothetical protein
MNEILLNIHVLGGPLERQRFYESQPQLMSWKEQHLQSFAGYSSPWQKYLNSTAPKQETYSKMHIPSKSKTSEITLQSILQPLPLSCSESDFVSWLNNLKVR